MIPLGKSVWQPLRGSLLWLLAAILFSTGLAVFSWQNQATHLRKRNVAEAGFTASQGRLNRLREEEQVVDQLHQRWLAMQSNGLVGNGDRLAWIETMRKARNDLLLADVRYEFLPQSAALQQGTSMEPADRLRPVLHPMQVDMNIHHSADLLNFLSLLPEARHGLPLVRSCQLQRANRPPANLRADCQIDWLTLEGGNP